MSEFKLTSDFQPTGDQPQAIQKLVDGLQKGHKHQILLGVTGSGKTFTIANTIAQVQKPTLVLSHNKTLAAQLCTEFREFFPENAVEYFVSYYDYYQPEAYLPRTDTYIEKETDVNEEIDKLRNSATRSVLSRRDVIVTASVSCIYGLGTPAEYLSFVTQVKQGEKTNRDRLVRRLVAMQYERNDIGFARGRFRIRGDTLEIQPAYEDLAIRVEFWGDEVERISIIDPLTGEILSGQSEVEIYPAKHFITTPEKLMAAVEDIKAELGQRIAEFRSQDKLLEAQRLQDRTNYDIEMLREAGYCNGVENYSRHLSRRQPGSPPWTLIDYFPDDFLLVIDESHMSVPQVRGMYHGDRARKEVLVDYGFRLPSAFDNRPLNFSEFEAHINQVIYTSATPGPYERDHAQFVVEQVIRPTGLTDPTVEIRPTKGQIDDLLDEIKVRTDRKERVLVTTLTKRMAEELADYIRETNVKTHYLHSEVATLERIDILRDLRLGVYDVVVGINLLREGLDLPEVSLVAILDADKEGYLRSETALIQTMGRAARHVEGHIIMYADVVTESMRRAIDETDRRRKIQKAYNREHGITPEGIKKSIKDITDQLRTLTRDEKPEAPAVEGISREEIVRLIKNLESQMKAAAKDLEFEKAALLRDQIMELRKVME
ncbi:MAG: excinuclease ABC subunit UvrB [Chloroflexota bacterium]|nr:excinuclease ABC subunit UvrB [Chloroflexota bacterium]